MRSGATPDRSNKAMISAARCALRTRVKRRRDVGNSSRICTQQASSVSLALVRLLKLPNVTKPASRAGKRTRRRRRTERPEAPLRIRQTQQALAMPGIGRHRRIGYRIGNAIVHGREAGRGGVSQIADLHGRGTARENRQPVGCRVSREIDEDVDPIGADQLDQRIVGQPPDIAPVIGVCAQALRLPRPEDENCCTRHR